MIDNYESQRSCQRRWDTSASLIPSFVSWGFYTHSKTVCACWHPRSTGLWIVHRNGWTSLAFGTLCSSQGAVVTVRRGSAPGRESASCRDTACRVAVSPGGASNATTSGRTCQPQGRGPIERDRRSSAGPLASGREDNVLLPGCAVKGDRDSVSSPSRPAFGPQQFRVAASGVWCERFRHAPRGAHGSLRAVLPAR
jgi:hypothetical protein